MSKDRFYKANEDIIIRFYQMPKALFNNPRYKGLSLGAKAMYSILRDRQELSISNNLKNEEAWVDEEGNIFLLFPIEPKKDDNRSINEKEARELSLTEILEIDRKTVMKYKKELIKYELIIDKRQGQGKTSRTYVLKPELAPENVEFYEKSKKGTSRSPKNVPQEVQKKDGNDTYYNDTYYNDTDFSDTIFLSPKTNDELCISMNNSKNERQIESNYINQFNEILINSEYENFEEKDAIKQALRLLYYSDKPLKVGNMSIPPAIVREDLKQLKWEHLDFAVRDFQNQSNQQTIKHPVAYLSKCIYNAMFQGKLRMEAELRYHNLI